MFNLPLAAPRAARARPRRRRSGRCTRWLLDLPTLDGDEPPVLTRLAVFADPWPGAGRDLASGDGELRSVAHGGRARRSWARRSTICRAARPAAGTTRHALRVQLYGGALVVGVRCALFGGANAAAVQRADGAWEVIQFANAELVGDGHLRAVATAARPGRQRMGDGDPLPAGAPFVLLDEHVVPVARGLDALDRTLQLRVVAAGRDHGDPAALALEAHAAGDGAAPARAGASARRSAPPTA